ncbi:MAG: 4Fe-4S dicluster domain-containing protein [Proteobacteria bacterium]|nr:4Fe-4S dicluster domain-containing protein [Pseudomonadota bacterium]
MKRRDFFRLGVRKAAQIAAQVASARVPPRAQGWLRPPFALDEPEFLETCTRCDKCIAACPYDVLFALAPDLGHRVAGTPAMDLLDRGCHLCADWPCVSACEPNALRRPDQGEGTPPAPAKLALVRIDTHTCLPYSGPECGACAESCPVPGALEWEGGLRPVINEDLCTGCALCREACIVDPKAIKITALTPEDEDADEETAAAS